MQTKKGSIFIDTCRGCGEPVLIWPGSPDAICYRCGQLLPYKGERLQIGLGEWTGGGLSL